MESNFNKIVLLHKKAKINTLHKKSVIWYIFIHTYTFWDQLSVYLPVVIIYYAAITVIFSQTMYSVNENTGPAQPVLVLSEPLSFNITVEVYNTDGSATGEYCSILINY